MLGAFVRASHGSLHGQRLAEQAFGSPAASEPGSSGKRDKKTKDFHKAVFKCYLLA
ncbi:hypothetical protein NBRC111894_3808 [Sporolactobacillus inulinus]|uniref:Uncharacterized protein n=1 Tax=Sporolactobacillus inulinus TaxID=2078 RepID=A0A4Y1ZH81_9BACL|nr:hypothetical protein NBRC111894_3808 [Sporolactobacillus inulinus]